MSFEPSTNQPPGVRISAKREAILAAAAELFLEVGYGAASMNQLVERVGGSKSTVYAHFKSKEKLFESVVIKLIGDQTAALSPVELAGMELRQGLELIGRRLLELVLSERHINLSRLVVAEARRFPEIGGIYYRHGPALAYKTLENFLEDHHRAGHIVVDDPRAAADFLTGAILHRATFRRFCIDPKPPRTNEIVATVKGAVDHFIRAFSTPGTDAAKKGEA
ncbi:MAG: TetR/AcrR family transcriptional regulator [Sphingomonadales bacterium]